MTGVRRFSLLRRTLLASSLLVFGLWLLWRAPADTGFWMYLSLALLLGLVVGAVGGFLMVVIAPLVWHGAVIWDEWGDPFAYWHDDLFVANALFITLAALIPTALGAATGWWFERYRPRSKSP